MVPAPVCKPPVSVWVPPVKSMKELAPTVMTPLLVPPPLSDTVPDNTCSVPLTSTWAAMEGCQRGRQDHGRQAYPDREYRHPQEEWELQKLCRSCRGR